MLRNSASSALLAVKMCEGVVQDCVVILSSQMLFAEGVACRLRQHILQVDVRIVDAREPDAAAAVAAYRPAVVVLDVAGSEATRVGQLDQLLVMVPGLKIIRLDPAHERIHIVMSEQRAATQVRDLILAIAP